MSPRQLLLRRPTEVQKESVHHRSVKNGETDGIRDARQTNALLPAGNDGGALQMEVPGDLDLG